MGEPAPRLTRNEKNMRVSAHLLVDVPLLIAILVLVVFGLLMQYSASWNYSLQVYDSGTRILFRQIVWVLLGTALAFICFKLDLHGFFYTAAPWLLLITGISLAVVLIDFTGSTAAQGYTRSLLGNGSVQPSEPTKLALIIYMSWLLTHNKEKFSNPQSHSFLISLFVIIILAGLVLLQPDYSTAITIVLLGIMMYLLDGGSLKPIGLMAVILSGLVVAGYFLFDKVGVRFNEYISGLTNPEEASYHIQRAYNAIVSGGILGVGLGKGTAKLTGLPVAWTDSIYAVILEETGLIGGVAVIILYFIILWRGYKICTKAPDNFTKLLAAGLSLWIFMEASINICVMLNILPFAGNALPLISFGGSSVCCNMMALGILLNISRVSARENFMKGKSKPDAIINLRGGDWGWRISRPGSSSSRNESN